jgi:hypothetical protein
VPVRILELVDALDRLPGTIERELDSLLEDLADRARAISAYDVFDPIRVLSADLRLEAEQPPLATA